MPARGGGEVPHMSDPFSPPQIARRPAPPPPAAPPAEVASSPIPELEAERGAALRKVDNDIEFLMRARYPLIYILSSEEKRVEDAVRAVVARRDEKTRKERKETTKVYTWSITEGVRVGGEQQGDSRDPLKALQFVLDANKDERAVFLFRDLHPFYGKGGAGGAEVVRRLRDLARALKLQRKTVFLISPMLAIPPEAEKEIAVVEYPLPDLLEIGKILDSVITRTADSRIVLEPGERERVVEAALGLTADEAESVFAKSLVQTASTIDPATGQNDKPHFELDVILSEKERIVRKSGILEFFRTTEKMESIGGLDRLKDWLKKRQVSFSKEALAFGLPRPKGILMIGIPGCGKSLTAKAVGAKWRLPLLRLDVGKVFAGIVGSSEENMRRAIQMAEAVAPSILWVDELEKGFSGTGSSNNSDGGTAARVFGSFITWLQEKTSPVFVIATANDVEQLPPELLRKGRFDEIFFVDLPTLPERRDIVKIHIQRRGRDPSKFDIEMLADKTDGFSGAEIEQAVVSALFDAFDVKGELNNEGILHSLSETVPLSKTMKEKIAGLRQWCNLRARPASSEYAKAGGGSGRLIELDQPHEAEAAK